MPTIAIDTAAVVVAGQLITLPLLVDTIEVEIDIDFEARVTGVPQDHANDVIWYVDNDDNIDSGYEPAVGIAITGDVVSRTILENGIEIDIDIHGSAIAGDVVESTIDLEIEILAEWYSSYNTSNWVAWSKIGELSFVKDKSNEAGDRPMDWPGHVWQVKKLDGVVVAYGSHGVTIMTPVSEPVPSFGFDNILGVGIKSAYSVDGTDHVHFFISTSNDLYRLNKSGVEKLGFAEFFGPMHDPVLNYFEKEQELFISDGTTGYIFKDGLGGGYATLTGITQNYVISPEALTPIPFSLMTDIIDFGQRGVKTLTFVEVGMDTIEDVYAAVDFRYTKNEAWRTSPWVLVNPEGVARINISAVEFRVRLKQVVYDPTRIDYINARHQRGDKRFRRGPMFDSSDQGGIG